MFDYDSDSTSDTDTDSATDTDTGNDADIPIRPEKPASESTGRAFRIHTALQEKMNRLLEICASKHLPIKITSTLRTRAEQEALYAQGRTAPGNIVTNAAYPYSGHNWGIAFDFCRNEAGREYDDSDGFFARVGAIGKSIGLAWGGDWIGFADKPHFELPGYSATRLAALYSSPENFEE